MTKVIMNDSDSVKESITKPQSEVVPANIQISMGITDSDHIFYCALKWVVKDP